MTKRFTVGDRVKIIDRAERYFGCTGTIIEDDKSACPYRIEHVDGVKRRYLIEDVGPISGPMPLTVGDKVRFTEDADSQDIRRRYFPYRSEFTVEEINRHGNIAVGGRRDRFFKAERFERITEVKAVPVPAPKVEPASKFKAGDKVVALNNKGCHTVTVGKTYEIVSISPRDPDRVEGKLVTVKDERGRTYGQFESRWALAKEAQASLAKAEAPKPVAPFKIGDFVEVVTGRHYGNQKGDRGYVYEVIEQRYSSHLNVQVRFEGEGSIKKQKASTNSYNESDLALVTTGSFIVVNRKEGLLLPATNPLVHTTRELAEKEALRLAELTSVSGEFVVFQAVSSAVVPPVPVRPKAELKTL